MRLDGGDLKGVARDPQTQIRPGERNDDEHVVFGFLRMLLKGKMGIKNNWCYKFGDLELGI